MTVKKALALMGCTLITYGAWKTQDQSPLDPDPHGGCTKTIQVHDHAWNLDHTEPIRLPTTHPSTLPCKMADYLIAHSQGDVNGRP